MLNFNTFEPVLEQIALQAPKKPPHLVSITKYFHKNTADLPAAHVLRGFRPAFTFI
jgi:hypothetical protein